MKCFKRIKSHRALTMSCMAAIVVCGAVSTEAVMIDGGISLAGGYTPDNPDLNLATRIDFGPAIVISSSGDFSMPIFTPVTMASSLTFDPLFSVDANPLWSVGGFAFELLSLSIVNETSTSITLNGIGNVAHSDFEDTTGTWAATMNSDGRSTFSWSSSTVAVPDGGTSITLLGIALLGVGLFRKQV